MISNMQGMKFAIMFNITYSITNKVRLNEHYIINMRPISPLPIPVGKALKKLGSDIHDARRRRRITMELMAERAGISRTTLTKVEKGDASVALGIYASVLFVLGMSERLADLADIKSDETGLMLDEENLPVRIRLTSSIPKRKKSDG
jgi:transcriptional regulator with XRE-family HTH domain